MAGDEGGSGVHDLQEFIPEEPTLRGTVSIAPPPSVPARPARFGRLLAYALGLGIVTAGVATARDPSVGLRARIAALGAAAQRLHEAGTVVAPRLPTVRADAELDRKG